MIGEVPSGLVAALQETSRVVALEASAFAVTPVAGMGWPAFIEAEAVDAEELPLALVPTAVKV